MVLRFGLGLVGDECEDESAEEGDAEAGGQQDVARCEGFFEFGFGFVVHGSKSYEVGGVHDFAIRVDFNDLGVFLPKLGI
jgi:hypothetical protein